MLSRRVKQVAGYERVAIDRGWECAASPAGAIETPSALGALTWVAATVPGTAASALRAVRAWSWDDRRNFDGEDWWWRTKLPAVGGNGHGDGATVLGLDGLATLADIWIDGTKVASTDNMFVAREVALERARAGSELVIRCRALDAELAKKRARPRWKVPMLEQQQLRWIRTTLLGRTAGWSPPCPAVGPWRPVWLERRGSLTVGQVALDARVDSGAGIVEVAAELGGVASGKLVVSRGDTRISGDLRRDDTPRGTRWVARVAIADPARWWPHTHGEPARYAVALETDAGVIDLGMSGFRTVEIEDADRFALRINGARVFCRGACWTPLDVVALGAPASAYDAAVAQARDAGMNMVRVGGTMVYEDDALYDALDAAGVLLWQDLMFANMDYPDDPAFAHGVVDEVDQQLSRLQARPSLAVVCGNSEGEQQASMWGSPRERWQPPLFADTLAARARELCPGVPYVPSSATGGAFPHAANAGPSSYYGVGAYLRGLDDARRSEVRFATECLAFANVPASNASPGGLPSGVRVHQPLWKQRAPRDLGAGWDFDDVRDHYVRELYGVEPSSLRYGDHDRYLALGRAATGEVMARTFAEWRRARSACAGGLVWFLRDLWPGAGWGVVDASGAPKPCWFALRRALAPIAVAITDEGVNGLALHVANDRGEPFEGTLEIELYRAGEIVVGRGTRAVAVPAHGAIEVPAAALFDHFLDLSYAYRFGPPVAQVVHASLMRGGQLVSDAFHLVCVPGQPALSREVDVGLSARAVPLHGPATSNGGSMYRVEVSARRFAHAVTLDAPGWIASDDHFSLAPGQTRTITLRRAPVSGALRGHASALNAEATAKIEVVA